MIFIRNRFVKESDSISKLRTGNDYKIAKDIDIINSHFLINNIDLAFEAHNRLQKKISIKF